MNAYDYKAQRWLTGAKAKTERLRQIADELDLLKGESRKGYSDFLACAPDERITELRKERAQIMAEKFDPEFSPTARTF